MTYNETHKPAIGKELHLAFDYWRGNNKAGGAATVVDSRKHKGCASGLTIFVAFKDLPHHKVGLDARWFQEYGKDFVFKG